MKIIDLRNRKTSMWHKLLLYMLTLVLVVVIFISVGLFFIGQYSTTTEKYTNNLNFQYEFYSQQIDRFFDDLSMMSEMLATDSSVLINDYFTQNSITLNSLNDSQDHTEGVQKLLFPKLKEELLKANASGAFILLNATVNTNITQAEKSRTGIYVQRSTDRTDEELLIYRGATVVCNNIDVKLHRKWRLEFKTDLVTHLEELITDVHAENSVLSDIFTLHGTSERVMLFLTPLIASDGSRLGMCGFEISENYFKNYFAQPTLFEKLTCLFSKTQANGEINCDKALWSGILGGYSLKPSGNLISKPFSESLCLLEGETKFIAFSNTQEVCNDDYTLTIMLPKSEFDKMVAINVTRIILLVVLLTFAAVVLCVVFSRRFVTPVIHGLERIRKQEQVKTKSNIIEIDDLFVYLAEQDRIRELETDQLKRQNSELASVTEIQTAEIDRRQAEIDRHQAEIYKQQAEIDKQQAEIDKQQAEIDRLSYSRKTEIDPNDYETFKQGLKELTKTEKTIFDLYLQGKTAKEIIEVLNVRESTLKFHNHNILDKLGVSSRKQMLRYATLLKQESQS